MKILLAVLITLMATAALAAQSVSVRWQPPLNADTTFVTQYHVFVSYAPGFYTETPAATVDQPSPIIIDDYVTAVVDVAAHIGEVVYMVVKAENILGNLSGPSNEISIALNTAEWIPPPDPPRGAEVVATDTGM